MQSALHFMYIYRERKLLKFFKEKQHKQDGWASRRHFGAGIRQQTVEKQRRRSPLLSQVIAFQKGWIGVSLSYGDDETPVETDKTGVLGDCAEMTPFFKPARHRIILCETAEWNKNPAPNVIFYWHARVWRSVPPSPTVSVHMSKLRRERAIERETERAKGSRKNIRD